MEVSVVGVAVAVAWSLTGGMEVISGGGELLRGTALFCALIILFQHGNGPMIMEWMRPPAALKEFEAEAHDLYSWAASLEASPTKCERIVALLNVRWLCSLLFSRNTFRVAGISKA
jgi:hypothetical protein